MRCATIYLKNSDKAIFSDLKKCAENDYIWNKAEKPRTVTAVQSLLLNYQPNYNYNRKYQSQGVSNQLMCTHRGKTGDDEGEKKDNKQKPWKNLDHIN